MSLRRYPAVFFSLVWLASASQAQLLLEPPLHGLVLEGIDLTLNQQYEKADSLFRHVVREFPESPVGFVYRAGVFQARNIESKLAMDDPGFDSLLVQARESSERMIRKRPDDPWGYFFLGTTFGYDAYARVYRGDWLGGTMKGISSVREFRKAVERDSSLFDAYVGIGTYTYWRSRKTEFLHWLPFVPDEREAGMAFVWKTVQSGVYNRYTAISVLASMELDAGRGSRSKELAGAGVERYPQNRTFLWVLGEADMKLGDYSDAMRTYGRLLSVLKDGNESNVYNEMVCLLNLARAHAGIGDSSSAMLRAQQAVTIADHGFPAHLTDRGREKANEARRIVELFSRATALSKE
ncbi:MAG: tetratricopeptide repeat protein [Bacteroidota bacterium]